MQTHTIHVTVTIDGTDGTTIQTVRDEIQSNLDSVATGLGLTNITITSWPATEPLAWTCSECGELIPNNEPTVSDWHAKSCSLHSNNVK